MGLFFCRAEVRVFGEPHRLASADSAFGALEEATWPTFSYADGAQVSESIMDGYRSYANLSIQQQKVLLGTLSGAMRMHNMMARP